MNASPVGRDQLVMLARGASPGRCKRRLACDLNPQRAAIVQARLSAHTLAAMRYAPLPPGTARVVAVQGLARQAARRWIQAHSDRGARRLRLVIQGAGSLGLLMQRQVMRARREGARRVVLIGSDLPQLESGDLGRAFAALERTPLVLGPATDGGYWLIGMRGSWPGLFAGIAWGSERVLAQTLAAAAATGLAATLLSPRTDLDRLSDLAAWR